MDILDTVVALATPRVTGALAVVRLSGPQSLDILSHMVRKDKAGITPNEAFFATVYDGNGADGKALDQAVIVFFKGPRSYTGEDTVEFSLHGSPAVADSVCQACIHWGARAARPGEFSLKAYLNGKMTLLQAEGVDDFIRADSATARSLALAAVQGESSVNAQHLKRMLLDAVSEAEYVLEDDLSDHADYLSEMTKGATESVIPVLSYAESLLRKVQNAQRLYEGIDVAIIGRPNVGKSALLNALVGQDRAIVTPIPGTTRDIVEGEKEIEGVLFRFKDTAGLRETSDEVERLGVERSRKALAAADIVILLSDTPFAQADGELSSLLVGKKTIRVGSKGDRGMVSGAELMTAALRGNTADLEKALVAKAQIGASRADASLMSARDMGFLVTLADDIKKALAALRQDGYVDAFSDMLRRGIDAINELLGTSTSQTGEDIYTTIFARFCLGK